jgi:hypothetical protein
MPEKIVELYSYRILDFKAMMKTVFKADKDTAQIIHVHKIVDVCTTSVTGTSFQLSASSPSRSSKEEAQAK